MLNLDELSIDRFKITIDGSVVEINPPKKKILKKVMELSNKNSDDTENIIDGLYEAVGLVLNSNKTGRNFDTDFIEEKFDFNMATVFLTKFFEWTNSIRQAKN